MTSDSGASAGSAARRFEGRSALVTGAGSGIGRATALRLAAEGARVCVADVDAARASDAVRQIEAAGGRAQAQACDVTEPAQLRAAIEATRALAGGRLDVVVNNAALPHGALVLQTTDEDWRRVQRATLESVFVGTREALAVMAPQGGGAIVNVSSGAGLAGEPMLAAYGAAKAGVINLTRTAAVENARFGVRVNVVCPGPIETPPMLAWLEHVPGGRPAFEAQIPQRRLGAPEEIASLIAFLASDEAAYVNGAVIVADGAISARSGAPRFD